MRLRAHGKHRKGLALRYVRGDGGILTVNGSLTTEDARRIKERFTTPEPDVRVEMMRGRRREHDEHVRTVVVYLNGERIMSRQMPA